MEIPKTPPENETEIGTRFGFDWFATTSWRRKENSSAVRMRAGMPSDRVYLKDMKTECEEQCHCYLYFIPFFLYEKIIPIMKSVNLKFFISHNIHML